MKVLLLELWGLGDAVMMTAALRPLATGNAQLTVLCKPGTGELLQPSYPQVEFLSFDAPWTAFRGKYRLASWPWKKIFQLIRTCRSAHFAVVASVRADPRDHLLMWLFGVSRRLGFPRRGSGVLLTDPQAAPPIKAHRVDLWRQLGAAIEKILDGPSTDAAKVMVDSAPFLDSRAYRPSAAGGRALQSTRDEARRPIVGLHCGARIAVRRWDESAFAETIRLLRRETDFHLALFPDHDGYGSSLLPLADSCHEKLSIPELTAELAACDVLICNDSGPGHIAAAMGRAVLAIFGPTQPDWFRPYGEKNHVVIRDICPFRPCFDYCRFPQPICLTQLTPDVTWPEIRTWFQQQLSHLGLPAPASPSL